MAPNEKFCHGKDVFERMNFLYQASHCISEKNVALASYYGSIATGCGKKAVLRMDSSVKRTICKSCQSPLIPGETARVRLISKPVKAVKLVCKTCKWTKKIPAKKGYKIWTETPESLMQLYDYSSNKSETKNSSKLENQTTKQDSEKNNEKC